MDILIPLLVGIAVSAVAIAFFAVDERHRRAVDVRLQRESRWDWAVHHADRLTKSEMEIWKHLHTLETKVRDIEKREQSHPNPKKAR